ncbi:4-hydroxy-tetrahydrodipicolinate reductase [Campylobacter hepaticus]|uniref:4-hydroxy-tetrahydrodipicolinate reductase n=1 Tax=Campylobacter hepaticus TaxID=1813019 RepID=A0A424Z0T9_9BACT|nr:4-hydroxy-tetrahydrodipicolinate reductase [Campylobacter hepaticus]AXP09085.1 4-hydroxy-tetrahydrodipicolinate reductase [Campylobacter hepaticus]MCZ0771576.1 4-hydroxy-tetrahydrodipicolinate reductase [Campylobacter hepaticus]MCZ0773044.1 4-hydroxy-tetrahydrodipicolinate reductase [Campylobacter hepaticus]MCZ0775724.1 4-hydroxy-tetrahydrodipicolinate reductase [Campylobacter hepaticus]MDX2323497.1 4-hydroxy-tetrahydrodipicolinate reductase [Campylobacter hepaticus]
MVNIGIYGAKGRMGKEIQACLKNEKEVKNLALYDKDGNLESFFKQSDVIIDFSSAEGTYKLLNYAKSKPKALVIGTTGLDEKTFHLMQNISELMPIFYATNMSLGVAVLNHLVSQASTMLKNFDIEILEMHHRHKKDAPSGTAISLAESAAKARNLDLKNVKISGRDGIIGERKEDEIAIMSLRGGDIVGRHTVGFYEEGEFLELHHSATSRATFAKGAIKIAIWLSKQKAKMYSINDFLGI